MTIMPPRSGDATPDGAETAAAETAEEAAVAARRLGCLFVSHGVISTGSLTQRRNPCHPRRAPRTCQGFDELTKLKS